MPLWLGEKWQRRISWFDEFNVRPFTDTDEIIYEKSDFLLPLCLSTLQM